MGFIFSKLKTIFSHDRYFYGFLIFLIIFIGQLPIILHYFHTPAGYYYPLLDKPSFSDYYYLGLIRYGMGSKWLLQIPYVIADHQASVIQIFFVILGKLSLVTGVGPAEMFALFRILGGLLYALSVAIFLKIILPQMQAKLAFVFFLFAQPLPGLDIFGKTGINFDNWVWHFGEAARRISAMPPHYTFGKGLAVLSLVFLILYLKNKKIKYSLVAGLLIFLAGMIYPPPSFIMAFSLAVAFVVHNFNLRVLPFVSGFSPRGVLKLNNPSLVPPANIIFIVFYLLMALLPLVILKFELSKGYPWDMWNRVELGWNTASMQFEWGYVRSLGVLSFLVGVYLLSIFGRRVSRLGSLSYLRIFISIWFFSSFLLFPFANMLHLGKFRFTEGAQIVPQAIVSLWGFNFLSQKIQKFRFIFLSIFILNFAVFTTLSLLWSTKSLWPLWTNVYIRPQEVAALKYLENQTPKGAIVMASTFPSNFIPAFAQVRTIIGFSDFYPEFSQFKDEESKIQNILYGNTAEKEVREYLLQRNVNYVYRDSSVFGKKVLYPQFLEVVFQNDPLVVYKVNRQMLQ